MRKQRQGLEDDKSDGLTAASAGGGGYGGVDAAAGGPVPPPCSQQVVHAGEAPVAARTRSRAGHQQQYGLHHPQQEQQAPVTAPAGPAPAAGEASASRAAASDQQRAKLDASAAPSPVLPASAPVRTPSKLRKAAAVGVPASNAQTPTAEGAPHAAPAAGLAATNQVAAAAGCHAVATSNPPAAAAKEPVLAEGAGGPIHVKQQSRSQVTPNLAVQQAPSTTQPPGAAVAAAAASGTPPVLAAANLPITAAAGAPAAAAPGAELEWGPGPTAQNLAAYEAELQHQGMDWTSTGGSADSATLLGALLHALKLTQPWDKGLEGLAATDPLSSGIDEVPEGLPNTTTSSSSTGSCVQQACSLLQSSTTLKTVWPVALEMILAGHLEERFTKPVAKLCFYKGEARVVNDIAEGIGSSAHVLALPCSTGSALSGPQSAVKCYNANVSLRAADQEVHAMQLLKLNGCMYVMALEGMALLTGGQHVLTLGLVMPRAGRSLRQDMTHKCGYKDEAQLRTLLFQALLGVHELHTHHIWHRDLSPGNFLLVPARKHAPVRHQGLQLVVSDLGASKVLDELATPQHMSVVHTPGFGAPEYLDAAQGDGCEGKGGRRRYIMPGSRSQWPKADMWSVGAVAAYMWCGHVLTGWNNPELDCTQEGLRTVLMSACATAGCKNQCSVQQPPAQPPEGLLQLLTGCLAVDPSQRRSAEELLRLSWFEPERGQMLYKASQRPVVGTYGPALEALVESWKGS